jgi:hypothetical protein
MKSLFSFGIIMATLLVSSCGGNGDTILNPGGGTSLLGFQVATLELLVSSPSLGSDATGNATVQLIARAKDAGNNVIPGVAVTFNASSGSISNFDLITDLNGVAMADLSNGSDPTNRIITVSVTDGSPISATVQVTVSGTSITVTGPSALSLDDIGRYTIFVADSEGVGITGRLVTVASAQSNTITPVNGSLVTDAGNVSIDLEVTSSISDTLTVTALGETATKAIAVSDDLIEITQPTVNPVVDYEIFLGTPEQVEVHLVKGGANAGSETINLSTTRGVLVPADGVIVTNASGLATASISSTSAGPATITASHQGLTTSIAVEFVATVADSISLQAEPATVGPLQASEITATVRDPNGNLVKNKVVTFVVDDVTTGGLSVSNAPTDSLGQARTVFTASNISSGQNLVQITASVVGTAPLVADTISLTVAGQSLFIVIGTGNNIIDDDDTTFKQEWAIFVTDAVGNAVPDQLVQVSLRSINYYKGTLLRVLTPPTGWIRDPAAVRCADEDLNLDGIFNAPDFDENNNGKLEAGNVASVAPVPVGAPEGDLCQSAGQTNTIITDGLGRARVCVIYPQDHGIWVDVKIEAQAAVVGTEFSTSQQFLLPVKAQDYSDITTSPPGSVSPFGGDLDCSIPPP